MMFASRALAAWRPWGRACCEVLFPPACVACDALGCEPFCAVCSAGVDAAPPVCLSGLDPIIAVWIHGGPVAQAIHRFKYRGRVDLARPLGNALAARVGELKLDLVVPIPLSEERLRARGYNQARELARSLAAPVRTDAVRRIRDRPTQVGRTPEQRRVELDDVFRANPRRVRDRRVLLLDDVVTTGATALAAANALYREGAASVGLLALSASLRASDEAAAGLSYAPDTRSTR